MEPLGRLTVIKAPPWPSNASRIDLGLLPSDDTNICLCPMEAFSVLDDSESCEGCIYACSLYPSQLLSDYYLVSI